MPCCLVWRLHWRKSAGEEINELITPEGAFGPIIEEQPLRIPSAQFGNAFERIDVGTPIPVKDKDGNDVVLYVQEKASDHALLNREITPLLECPFSLRLVCLP